MVRRIRNFNGRKNFWEFFMKHGLLIAGLMTSLFCAIGQASLQDLAYVCSDTHFTGELNGRLTATYENTETKTMTTIAKVHTYERPDGSAYYVFQENMGRGQILTYPAVTPIDRNLIPRSLLGDFQAAEGDVFVSLGNSKNEPSQFDTYVLRPGEGQITLFYIRLGNGWKGYAPVMKKAVN